MTKIIVDNSICEAFIRLQSKHSVVDDDIAEVLSLDSYKEAIELMGKNWSIGLQDEWFKTLSYAISENTLFVESDLTKTQNQYAKYIREQFEKPFTKDYRELLANGDFVKLAMQFAPRGCRLDQIKIILGVFGPNAGGNKHLFFDVPFLMQLTDGAVIKLAAHEYNHVLRDAAPKTAQPKLPGAIAQSLYWFESEGIADLCNFAETCEIYESFGYAEKGEMKRQLNDIENQLHMLSDKLTAYMDNAITGKEYLSFLAENVRFHVIGYFMASTLHNEKPEAVRSMLGNPYGFYKEYQEICNSVPGLKKYAFAADIECCVMPADS